MKTLLSAALLLFVIPVAASTQQADRDGVRQAALDYVDALYEAKPALIEKSVSPQLTKVGFVRQSDGSYRQSPMTYQQLFDLAGRWNANGDQNTSVKDVQVLDVLDQTASAKLTASWGVDYMQLAKIDGAWKIVNIVWQTPPPGR